jgi:ribosome-binding factor A
MTTKPFQRTERVATLIHHQIALIITQERKLACWQKITITGATISKDMAYAKIFVSTFDEANKDVYLKELNQNAKMLRQSLAKSLNLRVTPQLTFVFDDTLAGGFKLSALIDKAVSEDEAKHKSTKKPLKVNRKS